MDTRTRLILGVAFSASLAGGALFFDGASAQRMDSTPQAGQNGVRGQSVTQLPDGRWLRLGGETAGGPLGAAALVDPRSGASTPLRTSLSVPRFDHSATVLSDGSVLIAGGRSGGGLVSVTELFDPATQTFTVVPMTAAAPRAGHTATLLPDGRVLVTGGTDGSRQPVPTEIWDLGAQTAESFPLVVDREGHSARLLSDGRILVSEGRRSDGASAGPLSIDTSTMTAVDAQIPEAHGGAPLVAGSIPGNGALDVALDTRIVVRFSDALRMDSVTSTTIRLAGARGEMRTTVVGAEEGRLAFVWPLDQLEEGEAYTLTIDGATDERGVAVVPATITFKTVKRPAATDLPEHEAWRPGTGNGKNGWRTKRPRSPWEMLPALQGPAEATAISGRVLRLDGRPLPDVTLEIAGHEAHTDRTGRFLLIAEDLQTGEHTLEIDARSANQPNRTYGFYEARIRVRAGMTNVLPFTIWSPLLDTAHQVTIPSPTTRETVITTPLIPGLELHLPAGTVIRDEDHQIVRTISITPIPLDRTPFPLPEDATFTMFFTIQPGGAYLYTPGRAGGWLVYPRIGQSPTGKRVRFFNYDPDDRGWYTYGMGTVRETAVVPDAKTRLYAFTGASFNDGNEPAPTGPPPGDCCGNDGDPVNLTTGIFTYEMTDLVVQDVMPLALTRTYSSQDNDPSSPRAFGIGMTHPYAIFLHSENTFQEADLILPDGGRVHYVRTPESGEIWWQTIFEHTTSPTAFFKSRITFWGGLIANGGWELKQKDGTVYVFGHAAPLQAIRDRNGNETRLTWSTTNSFGSGHGNLLRVTSPHGRWIEFSYYPGTGLVQQAKDNIGRTVNYTYDANGRLSTVTDPENHVTSYSWDANNRMTAVKPPGLQGSQTNLVTNEYTTAADAPTPVGWVKKQTFADGGTYQFTYNVTNGKSTETSVTDPRGFVRRVTFNTDGYTLEDVQAVGEAEEQHTLTNRVAGNFLSSVNDAGSAMTAYARDAMGNVTSVTRCLPQQSPCAETNPGAVTTRFTYEPRFNQVATVTDAMNHTRTMGYDSNGRMTTVADGLNNITTFTYNVAGQLLTVKDPMENVWTYEYAAGTLVKTIDPLQNAVQRVIDAAGRPIASLDQASRQTRYAYDGHDRPLSITDRLGGVTTYTYHPDGHLASVTDPRNNILSYSYDAMGRVVSRTDQLGKSETFDYDVMGNLVGHTDRAGRLTTFTYDGLDRLKLMTFADNSTTEYTYTPLGRVSEIADSVAGTIGWTFDSFGRLTGETGPAGSVTYTYDAAGRQTTMTAGSQPTLTYDYDAADRLLSVTQGATVFTYEYDDAGRRTRTTLPNGVHTEYEYDDAARLLGLTYLNGTLPIGNVTYSYDAAGRRIEAGGSFARVVLPRPVGSTMYDVGNRATQWGPLQLTYDDNGNLVSDGESSYVWNARNLLTSRFGPRPASFAYDPVGRRTSRTVLGTTTTFVYDGYDVVQEQRTGGATANLLRGGGIDELLAQTESGATRYPLLDALGSTIATADAGGVVVDHLQYEPFGRSAGAITASTSAGYTGRERDEDELYYYRARYYNPAVGRFLSEDPLGLEAGLNSYAYADDDPVNMRDPTGTVAVNIDPLKTTVHSSLDALVAACGGRLTFWGCGGLQNAKFGCECMPDGCGKYAPKVSLSGALRIHALQNPRNATVSEVIGEEMKHIRAAERGIEAFKRDAEAFEKSRYSYKWICDAACWRFTRNAKSKLSDEIESVHRTDPHPRR